MKSRQWEASVTDQPAVNAALVLKPGTKSRCFLEKPWKSRHLCQWGCCTEWLQPITRASHNQHCRRSSAKFSLLFQMASFFLKSWILKEHLMRFKLPIVKSSFLDSINHKIEMNVKQESRVYRLDVQVINFFNTHFCSTASFPLTHPCLHSYGKFTWSVKERKGRKRPRRKKRGLTTFGAQGFLDIAVWHCYLRRCQVPPRASLGLTQPTRCVRLELPGLVQVQNKILTQNDEIEVECENIRDPLRSLLEKQKDRVQGSKALRMLSWLSDLLVGLSDLCSDIGSTLLWSGNKHGFCCSCLFSCFLFCF